MRETTSYPHLRQTSTFLALGCAAATLLAPTGVVWASGQTVPVELAAHGSEIFVAVDENVVRDVRFTRRLQVGGKAVERAPAYLVGASLQKGEKEFRYRVDDWDRSLLALPDGVYSQKLSLEIDRWNDGEQAAPLLYNEWFYYKVKQGRVKPISMREYSDTVAPPRLDWDQNGRPILSKSGTAIADELPEPIAYDAFDEVEAEADEDPETFRSTLEPSEDEGNEEES